MKKRTKQNKKQIANKNYSQNTLLSIDLIDLRNKNRKLLSNILRQFVSIHLIRFNSSIFYVPHNNSFAFAMFLNQNQQNENQQNNDVLLQNKTKQLTKIK